MGALTEPAPFDAETKLLKIAANDRHPQQLQALKLLRERDNCEACAARANEGNDASTLIRHANDDQRSRLVHRMGELLRHQGRHPRSHRYRCRAPSTVISQRTVMTYQHRMKHAFELFCAAVRAGATSAELVDLVRDSAVRLMLPYL